MAQFRVRLLGSSAPRLLGLFLTLALIFLAAMSHWLSPPETALGETGPPTIEPDFVAVAAPATGSEVVVTTTTSSFDPGTVDSSTEIKAVNVTTGADSGWTDHEETGSVQHTLIGRFGDLIELRARNGTDESVETIGYVPVPTSDAAPPDLVESSITGAINGANFELSGPTGVILDNSFPVVVELYSPTDSATDTISGNGTSSTETLDPNVLNVAASAGNRIRVVVRDDYGNETELVFIAGNSYSSNGAIAFHAVSPNQAECETAGTAGMIAAGDGSSAVTAYGRDFIHGIPVFTLPGPVLPLSVALTYRSGIAYGTPLYNGNVGCGWDWSLDARLSRSGSNYYWYPGDGRKFGPFNYEGLVGGLYTYDSPGGVFLELTRSSSALSCSPKSLPLS